MSGPGPATDPLDALRRESIPALRSGSRAAISPVLFKLLSAASDERMSGAVMSCTKLLVDVALTHSDLQGQCASLLAQSGDRGVLRLLEIAKNDDTSRAVAALEVLGQVIFKEGGYGPDINRHPFPARLGVTIPRDLLALASDPTRVDVAEKAETLIGQFYPDFLDKIQKPAA